MITCYLTRVLTNRNKNLKHKKQESSQSDGQKMGSYFSELVAYLKDS